MAGVAVSDTLGEFGLEARLKWPNDVLAGGDERKIAGILAEAASGAAGIEHVVLGIGVNLDFDPGPELRATATSVRHETGRAPALPEAAAALLAQLALWYDALALDGQALLRAWRARSVPWWGEPVEVRAGGRALAGVLRELDRDGALVIEGGDGTLSRVISGEVARLRRALRSRD